MTYTPQVDTYYFDASDAGPTDTGTVWTDDSSAFDGSESTDANSTAASGNLTAEGTNAPASNTYSGIIGVRCRVLSYANRAMTYRIREDAATSGTLLGTISPGAIGSSGSPVWSSWVQLDAPAAGWTWTKVQSLAIDIIPAGTGSTEVYRIEIEVTSAPTINNIWGAETGGMEEATGTTGSAVASTAQKHSGSYSFYVPIGANFNVAPFESVSDAGNDYIFGFWFYKTSGATARVSCADSGGGSCIEVRQSSSTSSLTVLDANGSTIDTTSNSVSDSEWHFMEVYWQLSATGSYEVFIDGVSITSGSGEDFDNATSTFNQMTFNYIGQAIYYDDMYIMSGCASAADRLGGCEVLQYSNKIAGNTPDVGDTLTSGFFYNTQEIQFNDSNLATYDGALAGAIYMDATTGGSIYGPNGDTRITGDILATKAIMRMSRGNGGGTDHFILLGNDTDGTTRSVDLDPGTSPANYFMASQNVNIVPTSSEYSSIGFEATGAQDFECYDMLATILHVPAVATGVAQVLRNPLKPFMHLLMR
jgi:hypothetical protein